MDVQISSSMKISTPIKKVTSTINGQISTKELAHQMNTSTNNVVHHLSTMQPTHPLELICNNNNNNNNNNKPTFIPRKPTMPANLSASMSSLNQLASPQFTLRFPL